MKILFFSLFYLSLKQNPWRLLHLENLRESAIRHLHRRRGRRHPDLALVYIHLDPKP